MYMNRYSLSTVKARLRELREEKNYTVQQLAELLSKKHSTPDKDMQDSIRTMYYKWENLSNEYIPSYKYLFSLCEIYGCDLEYFFDESMPDKTKAETDIKAKTGLTNKSIRRLLEAPKIQKQYKLKLLNPYIIPTGEVINLLLGTDDGYRLLDAICNFLYSQNATFECDKKKVQEVLYKTDTSNIPLQASDVSNILLLEIQHILMNIKENLQK